MAKKKNNIVTTINLGDKGTWEGTVGNVRFLGAGDYAIIELILNNKVTIVAEGKMQNPVKNARIKVTGSVVFNQRYNQNQIHVTSSDVTASPEILAGIAFLTSEAIAGFSTAKRASDFIEMFGTDLSAILTNEKKMIEFPRITANTAKRIKESFKENEHLYPMFLLTAGNITYNQANTIYDRYKEKAVEVVKHNPYRLIYELDKFGFATADKLALNVGFKYDTPERIYAALVHCVRTAASESGHTYLPKDKLFDMAKEFIFSTKELKNIFYQDIIGSQTIPNDTSDWEITTLCDLVRNHTKLLDNIIDKWGEDEKRDALCKKQGFTSDEIDCIDIFYNKRNKFSDLLEQCLLKNSFNVSGMSLNDAVFELNKYENINKNLVIMVGTYNETAITTRESFLTEVNIAEIITEMSENGVLRESTDENINSAISYIESVESKNKHCNYVLDVDQKDAVKMVIKNRFSIITGGPGRGKTTIIKTAIKAWEGTTYKAEKGKPNVFLLAPTGKAAKRMAESTGYPAKTIHRYLLSEDMRSGMLIDKNTLIIVDESSMIDLSMFNWLLSKTKNAQMVLVGDVDQLPSVGAGQVLQDLIKSGKIACTYLQTCHRNDGAIFYNSKVINEGGLLQELVNDSHFATRWYDDADTIIKMLTAIYKKMIDSKKYETKDMMILSPMNSRTATSVMNLNNVLQNVANPKTSYKSEEYVKYGTENYILREGDRVFQRVNNYKKEVTLNDGQNACGVFNGDTGTLIKYENKDGVRCALVLFDDGKKSYYSMKELSQLKLAYALSYHKSQGSEYKFVVCILMKSDYVLLQRKMLYTGETRAQEMCLFLGQAGAFQLAISNKYGESAKRYTTLEKIICQTMDKYKII